MPDIERNAGGLAHVHTRIDRMKKTIWLVSIVLALLIIAALIIR